MLDREFDSTESGQASSRPPGRGRPGDSVEQRVLKAAFGLAAEGGFEAVRQREVAQRAGVALGTLYKRFRSKDELLIGVLEVESRKLDSRLEREPPSGETELDRVTSYFEIATYYMVRKPRLGRAVLRAVTSGDGVSERIMAYHARHMRHVIAALETRASLESTGALRNDESALVASILLQVWFAALVGWSGGIYDADGVVDQVRTAARVVLRGLRP